LGGLIGTLAAANEELVKNDALMNFLGFFTMWMIMLFTYRSFAAGVYLLAPLALLLTAILFGEERFDPCLLRHRFLLQPRVDA
jgi:predicted RND superfamily exporter protein